MKRNEKRPASKTRKPKIAGRKKKRKSGTAVCPIYGRFSSVRRSTSGEPVLIDHSSL